MPCAQVRRRLNNVRGSGGIREIEGHAGIRILYDAVNKRRRSESEPIHVKETRAGLRVVTKNRILLTLERSRRPVISQIEAASQLRPGDPVGTVKQGTQVLVEIQRHSKVNGSSGERRGGDGCGCQVGIGSVNRHDNVHTKGEEARAAAHHGDISVGFAQRA